MNATDYTAAPVNASPIQPEAFLSYDCRPTWRWVACGPNYKYAIQIFYWVFCAVHTVSCLVAMGYTIWTFCACSSKPVPRSNRKLTLRVFTSFSVLAFGCTFLARPKVSCFWGCPSCFFWLRNTVSRTFGIFFFSSVHLALASSLRYMLKLRNSFSNMISYPFIVPKSNLKLGEGSFILDFFWGLGNFVRDLNLEHHECFILDFSRISHRCTY
jgi:hypothetical protein